MSAFPDNQIFIPIFGNLPVDRWQQCRLAYLLQLEGTSKKERFSPHGLRHACATRNYERHVDLVAIQQMLGHWHVGTTMHYITPSSTFIEDAYRRALGDTLRELREETDGS